MLKKKNYLTAAGTFTLALSVGFVMQNGDAIAAKIGIGAPRAVAQDAAPAGDVRMSAARDPAGPALPSLPRPPAAALAPVPFALDSGLAARIGKDGAGSGVPVTDPDQRFSPFGLACATTLSAKPGAAAMVDLTLNATCHGNEPVVFTHNGLTFSVVTSQIGRAEVSVPALAQNATFDARFPDGESVQAAAEVSDFSSFDRVAVQWQGESGLKIHALEFGADYRDSGHVWADAPRSAAYAAQARGGFITELGDSNRPDARRAEVYSFPTGTIDRRGTVRLSVEAEINPYNCNRDVNGQALQSDPDGKVKTTDLTLEMPACDAIGDFLVLKNLLRDIKIAQN